ncbi:hypothetical protein PP568_13200 [Mycobacteroides abscessus]|jgi:hypothetical protein|uniref:Secreted protein n=2 Tax=Mycobacteroides abscessus TaxID=36809 RepID=A0AB38D468_9MYCO|nr:hypothetical protein [Mycobacteroides abscessus]QSM03244.1 hypothetical protein PROPHIGD102-2_42 [Mycobacterium phage prophi102-2]QSM04016.1 hypothetical protein PROPHIGD54-1_42 [Mycobacterium phage prophiGD54-1]MBE5420159.1 hypothetical protein [Mycobacteroides abscessus]MBE5455142.1 hypothetical protein [Mycobacteroides abscessus]MBN7296741.1 hypothetical protein [Mycobacteroides abscessus subsp. abscessus]
MPEITDWLSAGAAVAAAGVAVGAAFYAWRGAKAAERSAEFAKTSAEASTRSADAAEEANRIAKSQLPPDVTWVIEWHRGDTFVLRNTGRVDAQEVEVDISRVGAPIRRRLPGGVSIAKGVGWDFMLKGASGAPMPAQLLLRWAGQEDWVAVPMPKRGQ